MQRTYLCHHILKLQIKQNTARKLYLFMTMGISHSWHMTLNTRLMKVTTKTRRYIIFPKQVHCNFALFVWNGKVTIRESRARRAPSIWGR